MNVPVRQQERREVAKVPGGGARYFDLQSFELMQRVARAFSCSTLVPTIYRGNTPEALGNCMIALNLAERTGADPMMVMQNLSVIQGRPNWSSPFLIAMVNTCGKFTTLRFEFFGERGTDGYGCRASATEKATGENLVGTDVTIKLAKEEGWYGRNGSKWRTMAQQMLIYRSAAFWTRAYAPELSMGLLTQDEAEDIVDLAPSAYREVAPRKSRPAPKVIEAETTSPELEAPADDTDTNPGEAPPADAEQPAETPPAGAPASPEVPSPDDAGADLQAEPEKPSPVEEARQAGRDACEAGVDFKDIPERFRNHAHKRKAWQDGYQRKAEEMGA